MGNKKNCQQFLPAMNDGGSLLSQMNTSKTYKPVEKLFTL